MVHTKLHHRGSETAWKYGHKKFEETLMAQFDREPPQAKDAEKAVLGAILLEEKCMDGLVKIFNPGYFYSTAHKKIAAAILQLYNESKAIDLVTVTERLIANNDLETAGGGYYVTQLTNAVGSSAHVIEHLMLVLERYLSRELLKHCMQTAGDLTGNADYFESYDKHLNILSELNRVVEPLTYKPFDHVIADRWEEIKQMTNSSDSICGIPCFLKSLDKQLSGLQKTDLIIVGGRPGMAKTSFALDFTRRQVERGFKVGFFSLEMSAPQLTDRLMSAGTGIPLKLIRRGMLSKEQKEHLQSFLINLKDHPLKIYDTYSTNFNTIRSTPRHWKLKDGLDIIYVDYLQLLDTSDLTNARTREQEMSALTRNLKSLAKELQVPVVALSQLSRECERRTDKRPMLSDLKESGDIEAAADVVLLLYRDRYYDPVSDDKSTEIIIAKHRNGATGMVRVKFEEEFTRFGEWE